ncbi:MAG: VOC family protein [Flavobacteriaceae bacterium]
MPKPKSIVLKILLESAMIIFSVFIALFITEWKNSKNEAAKTQLLVENIEKEIQKNKDYLKELIVYHEKVGENIRQTHRDSIEQVFFQDDRFEIYEVAPDGIIQGYLDNIAWTVAKEDKITNRIPLEVSQTLFTVYEQQTFVMGTIKRIANFLSSREVQKKELVEESAVIFETLMNELAGQERFLHMAYIEALKALNERKSEKGTHETTKVVSSDLQVDHVNIWVKNPTKAKELLTGIGFTSVPDSLSKVHTGQGTAGRYFNFLNGYLELIFVHDPNEMEENARKNTELDFTERANFQTNGASPFSIALKIKDYDIDKIPFGKVRYHQNWMGENANIYAAKNSKTNLTEPSIFVVYPEIESDNFETMADLTKIPDEYAIWREFFKHPNGAKKITSINITSVGLDVTTETMKAANGIENLTVAIGPEHVMMIYFDHNVQEKSFDLRPELPLILHL